MLRIFRRSIARNNMKRIGIERINRKRDDGRSFFAKHWREYDEYFKN